MHDPTKTILVVEDHERYRDVLRTALGALLPGFRLVDADSIQAALELMERLRPDVLVADMTLPDGTALDLVRQADAFIRDGGRTIVMSSHASDEMRPVLARDDVHGYVAKEDGVKVLARTILEVTSAGTGTAISRNL